MVDGMFKNISALAGLALAASLGTGQADTINYLGAKWGSYATVDISVNGSTRNNQLAGEFSMKNVDTDEAFTAYCIDVFDTIQSSFDYGDLTPAAPIPTDLDRLFTQYYSLVTDKNSSAAFQTAVWEIVTESDESVYNLASGNFRASGSTTAESDIVAQAQAWLTGLGSDTGGYVLSFYNGDDGNRRTTNSQDLVSASPVPLPASALLMLAGLGAFGAVRRRGRS